MVDQPQSYKIPIYDLPTKPGSARELTLHLPVPPFFDTPVIGVPADTNLEISVRLQPFEDGILAEVDSVVPLQGQCVRCLDPIQSQLEVHTNEMFFNPGTRSKALSEGDESAEDLREIEDETVDIESVLRDAVLPELSFLPTCRPDCEGLCTGCGIRMADAEPGHTHDQIDSRWEALRGLNISEETE